MVWYIHKFRFETDPSKLMELEKIIIDNGKTTFELSTLGCDDLSNVRLIEGKNSSFLRQSEDYFLLFDYAGIDFNEDMKGNAHNSSLGVYVASTNPDTKRSVAEKVKNYLNVENIKFEEENS